MKISASAGSVAALAPAAKASGAAQPCCACAATAALDATPDAKTPPTATAAADGPGGAFRFMLPPARDASRKRSRCSPTPEGRVKREPPWPRRSPPF